MARPDAFRPLYDNWAHHQEKLLESIRPLSLEQMQLRPSPTEWPIWMLCGNMVGGRLYWLCWMLGEDDRGYSETYTGWEDVPDHVRSAAEIEEAFLKTWEVVEDCLERWTLEDLSKEVTKNDWWGNPVTISPAWVLARLMTHEAHHGSEVSLILRVHGLPTSLSM